MLNKLILFVNYNLLWFSLLASTIDYFKASCNHRSHGIKIELKITFEEHKVFKIEGHDWKVSEIINRKSH